MQCSACWSAILHDPGLILAGAEIHLWLSEKKKDGRFKKKDGRFAAMVTKDLQTLNLKFDQLMLNNLVLTRERYFEVRLVFLSISIPNKCSWKLFRYLSVFEISYDKKWEKCDNLGL